MIMKKYRLHKKKLERVILMAEIEKMNEMTTGVTDISSYYVDKIIKNNGMLAKLNFEILKLEDSC